MAKVKYNVKGVDSSGGDFEKAKPGMYIAEIAEINDRESSSGNGAMLEVVFKIKSDSKGKKKDIAGIGSQVWHYVLLEHEPSAFRLREFLEAIGKVQGKKGEVGTLDTDKLIGLELQVQLKSDKDQDGEYRPRVGKVLGLSDAASDEDEDEPDEDDEDETDDEVEDDEEQDDDEEEDDDEEAIDLDELDRAELKKLIKDEELDIRVTKSMSDDDLREKIAEALGSDEDEDEDDEEEEEDDDDDGLDDLDRSALKVLIKEHELGSVKKSETDDDLRARLREADVSVAGDEDEDDDEAPDYSSWDLKQLNAELKERGLPVKGKMADKVDALVNDDKDDKDPF